MTRNLFYSAVSSGSAAFMLLLLLVAGRSLGVPDYGIFTIAISLATIAEVFMDFGLHQITIRAIARDATNARHLLETSLWLKALPGLAMILVFTAIAFKLRADAPFRLACLTMLVSATMRSYLLTARGILQGLERFADDALVTTADRALLFVGCTIAFWARASVVQVSLVFLGVRIVTAIGAVLLARRHVGPGRVDRGLWKTLPAEALPVGLFLLVLNLYNRIDSLMLIKIEGERAAGLYGAAFPVYEGLTYATAIVSAVLIPRLSRMWTERAPEYRRLIVRSQIGVFVLAVVVASTAWPLADFGVRLFGIEFAPASTTLRVLLLGLPFVYVTWILHAVAIAADRSRALLIVTAIGTALNVILNLFLIPRYSYNGAAVATVISEVVAMSALLYGLRTALRPRVV
jgi:O-antigen/teichoic acid export membrane protein